MAIKRKPVQNAEQNMINHAVLSVAFSIEREKEFIVFEKLFREQEDDLKKLTEELLNSLEKKAMLSYLIRNDIRVIMENFSYFYTLIMLLNQKKMKTLLKFLIKILL